MIVRITPVFLYWIALDVKGAVPLTKVDVWPVKIGISLPTCIRAGRLSVAKTLGEASAFTRLSVAKALIKARIALPRPAMPLIPAGNPVPRFAIMFERVLEEGCIGFTTAPWAGNVL